MRHFSPHYANEPLAAGALIKNMISKFHEDIGGPAYPVVQSISGIAADDKSSLGYSLNNALEQGIKAYDPEDKDKLKDMELEHRKDKSLMLLQTESLKRMHEKKMGINEAKIERQDADMTALKIRINKLESGGRRR
jgi:hypothetical protein